MKRENKMRKLSVEISYYCGTKKKLGQPYERCPALTKIEHTSEINRGRANPTTASSKPYLSSSIFMLFMRWVWTLTSNVLGVEIGDDDLYHTSRPP